MIQNNLTKIEGNFVIFSLVVRAFLGRTTMIDGGQTHKPGLSILYLNN